MSTPSSNSIYPRLARAGGRNLPLLLLSLTLVLDGGPGPLIAQEMPPSPVGYTDVREHPVQKVIRLPGSVESRTESVVASEVAGLVAELPGREGDVVRKGQPVARLSTTSLDLRLKASQAQLKEAESRLKLAERNLERARELFEEKVSSQEQLDSAFYEYTAWQARIDQISAEIQQIEYDLDRSVIRAPFAGTIVSERTEVGEWLAVGDPVVEMVSLAEIDIRVDVPERYFQALTPGARAMVRFESLPGYEVEGKLSAIIPRADPQARTFPIKVRVNNREGRIGVGMLALVALPAGESYRATVVPKDAVVRQGAQEIVFRINGDNTVMPVPVETGAGVGAWLAVKGELQVGEKVVTRGNERLQPGQTVQAELKDYKLP